MHNLCFSVIFNTTNFCAVILAAWQGNGKNNQSHPRWHRRLSLTPEASLSILQCLEESAFKKRLDVYIILQLISDGFNRVSIYAESETVKLSFQGCCWPQKLDRDSLLKFKAFRTFLWSFKMVRWQEDIANSLAPCILNVILVNGHWNIRGA